MSPSSAIDDYRRREIASLNLKRDYIHAATAENTRLAYRSSIASFLRNGGSLPATSEIIIEYLERNASKFKVATLKLHLSALREWHSLQKLKDPTKDDTLKKVFKGIINTHGNVQKQAAPLTLTHLCQICEYLDTMNTAYAKRNKAIILVAFYGAFRVSELSDILYENVKEVDNGYEILIPKSKTDKTRKGVVRAIGKRVGIFCPVNALKAWLQVSNISDGHLFRSFRKDGTILDYKISPRNIEHMLYKIFLKLDFKDVDSFTTHSTRRGIATLMCEAGIPVKDIMAHCGWTDVKTAFKYIEQSNKFGVLNRLDDYVKKTLNL